MKKVISGWTGKNYNKKEICRWIRGRDLNGDTYCKLEIENISKPKGIKKGWTKDQWPPKKVRVTVEVIE